MAKKLKTPAWRFKELFDALGGPNEIQTMIEARGFQPPCLQTIRGWGTRGSFPSKWLPLLLIVAMERKLLRSLATLDKTIKA